MATDDRIDGVEGTRDSEASPTPVDQAAAAPERSTGSGFHRSPTWLVTSEPKIVTANEPSRRGRWWLVGGCAAAVAIAATTVVLTGRGDANSTDGTPRAVAAQVSTPQISTSQVSTPEAAMGTPAAAWCEAAAGDGRVVGRGPGGTHDGPGVIQAFDHAYYVERDGARVASLMIEPNPVPEIQKWIDEVPTGTEHCLTIVSTPEPNVFAVDLVLRTPGREEGVIPQRITVAPGPGGFRIARVEDAPR